MPVRSSVRTTSRYSRLCDTGRSASMPYIPMTGTWLGPTPSRNRPGHAALAVAACWAATTGWRGQVGTTATPSAIRSVAGPASASAMIGSNPKAEPSHRPWKPCASVATARSRTASRLRVSR